MKRMHIHVGVERLDQAIPFYSALFGAEPSKTKTDYANWILEDPRINFAISTRGDTTGVDHLGIQVDEDINDLIINPNPVATNIYIYLSYER